MVKIFIYILRYLGDAQVARMASRKDIVAITTHDGIRKKVTKLGIPRIDAVNLAN